jgi:hypothetical protein
MNFTFIFEIFLQVSVKLTIGCGLNLRSSIPSRGKKMFFANAVISSLGPAHYPIQWTPGALSPGIKRPGREAGHYVRG